MTKNILLVDDDALLRRSLSFNLEQAGYKTHTAGTAEDALEYLSQSQTDLVLLDINLPGMDGLDALRIIRNDLKLPVILLTARRKELDEVLGLELGADDYVTKPFDISVLLAHIKAVLRRSQQRAEETGAEPITAGGLSMDPIAHLASLNGKELDLSPKEFSLLYTLARQPGQVISTDDLLTRVWGAEFFGQPQVIYVHIRWLREKIEKEPDQPEHILTVLGIGYKYVVKED